MVNALLVPSVQLSLNVDNNTIQDRFDEFGNYLESNWNEQIEDGGNYSLQVDSDVYTVVNAWNPSNPAEALYGCRANLNSNHSLLFNQYETIVVCDNRVWSTQQGQVILGVSILEGAGQYDSGEDLWNGVAYLAGNAPEDTALHELLHTYGGTHDSFSNSWSPTVGGSCSVMGRPNRQMCNGNQNPYGRGDWIGSCTVSNARTHIDSL